MNKGSNQEASDNDGKALNDSCIVVYSWNTSSDDSCCALPCPFVRPHELHCRQDFELAPSLSLFFRGDKNWDRMPQRQQFPTDSWASCGPQFLQSVAPSSTSNNLIFENGINFWAGLPSHHSFHAVATSTLGKTILSGAIINLSCLLIQMREQL
ncbi:hypothetical protein Ae201684P_011508 [Aphanomyces euteiches]|nr:hypothetical protein Ae201684P_011508 [Aphanomyces euteiches]